MRLENCIKRLVEQSNGKLNKDQAKEIFQMLEQGKERAGVLGIDGDDFIMAKAKDIAKQVKREALIESRNAKINLVKYKALTARIDEAINEGLPVSDAFQSLLVGVEANVKNANYSIDKQAKSLLGAELMGSVVSKMEEKELLDVWRNSQNSRQIAREMDAINKGTTHPESSKEIKEIAKILRDTQEYIRIRLNKAGADIGDLMDYIASTSHDSYKIQNASYFLQQRTLAQRLNPFDRAKKNKEDYEAWRDYTIQRLDVEKTFKDVADVEDFMKKTYDAFITGIHLKATQPDEDLFAFKGPANLAKKVSRKRVLHFKDADAWHDYNDIFGTGNNGLSSAIIIGFEKASRDIALIENLGTNPKAMLDRLVKDYKSKLRTSFNADKIFANSTEKRIDIFYKNVSGEVMIANNPNFARFGSVTRGVQTMSKLGGAVLSSVTDMPVAAAEITFQGENFFTAQAKAMRNMTRGRGNKFRKQTGQLTGQGIDAMVGAVASRFSANDSLPGQMSSLMTLFFKLNGLTWWTDVGKIGISDIMAGRLAQLQKVKFDKLADRTRQIFNYYGIEQKHWDLMRAGEVRKDTESDAIALTADAIDDIPDSVVASILGGKTSPAKLAEFKRDTKSRFNTYFQDRTDHAILEPGARENSILNLGLQRGTPEGEAIRWIMQFKSFPITFLSKVWGRELYSKGKSDYVMLLGIMATTTLMGYVAGAMKDMAKGKKPKNPFSSETWIKAFVQGGGAGIYGDFLFGEFNKYGNSLWATTLGPTAATLEQVAQTYGKIKSGEDFGASALNTALSNTPFANLFYLREPMNRLFIYQIQEYLNPGYISRMESRMKKDFGQEFFIKP